MKTAKPKTVARRGWIEPGGQERLLMTRQWHESDYPAALLDLRPEAQERAVEAMARGLAEHDWQWHDGSGLQAPWEGYLPEARAAFEALVGKLPK